jgi:hypothetical protein
MSLLDDARSVAEGHKIKNARKARQQHPTGWEPGVNTETGEVTGQFLAPLEESDYRDAFEQLLSQWGFDPAVFTIEDDRVEVRTWTINVGDGVLEQAWYYKAKIIRLRTPEWNVDDLVKRIRSRKRLAREPRGGNRAFAVLNADWQLGKRDGEGTDFTIRAVKNTLPDLRKRYESLERDGHEIAELHIYNLGDLIEGCVGHYPMQTFNAELSRREQVRLGRELLTEQLLSWSKDFDRVLVAAVAGNHGENRDENGKSFTNLGDNDDVALVESVAEAFDLVTKFGVEHNIGFRIPDNQLSYTLDVFGTIVGLTHGHVANFRAGAGKNLAHSKVWDWWYGQMMGRQPVADADILITGHYHYLSLLRQGNRTALQAPPLDGGSEWFVDTAGLESHAAITSLLIGGGTQDGQAGWSDLHVTQP